MRQILALVCCFGALPISAGLIDPDSPDPDHFTVRPNSQALAEGKLQDPASYLIVPPGRIGSKTVTLTVDGTLLKPKNSCPAVSLVLSISPKVLLAESPKLKESAAGDRFEQAMIVTEAKADWRRIQMAIDEDFGKVQLKISGLEVAEELPSAAARALDVFLGESKVLNFLQCVGLDRPRQGFQKALEEADARTFDESMTRLYGLSKERRFVDVKPGMRLCVRSLASFMRKNNEFEFGQEASECFGVYRHSTGNAVPTITFDPMISQFTEASSPAGKNGLQRAAHGIDLATADRAHRWFRVFYPKAWDRIRYAAESEPDAAYLIGLDDEDDLKCISSVCDYSNLLDFCGQGGGDPPACLTQKPCKKEGNRLCVRFEDRAIPMPEIRIVIDGNPEWVPIGTTFLDILDRRGSTAVYEEWGSNALRALLRKVKLRRAHGSGSAGVDFENAGIGALYLPLIQGDEISW